MVNVGDFLTKTQEQKDMQDATPCASEKGDYLFDAVTVQKMLSGKRFRIEDD